MMNFESEEEKNRKTREKRKGLSEYKNDLFERYNTSVDDLNSQTELNAFKSGFKLATRLMISSITQPKQKQLAAPVTNCFFSFMCLFAVIGYVIINGIKTKLKKG